MAGRADMAVEQAASRLARTREREASARQAARSRAQPAVSPGAEAPAGWRRSARLDGIATGVTVTNGRVEGFGFGVNVSSGSTASRLAIADTGVGIFPIGASDVTITRNRITDSTIGIEPDFTTNAVITRNRIRN